MRRSYTRGLHRALSAAALVLLSACGAAESVPAPSGTAARSALPVEVIRLAPRDLSRRITLAAPVAPLREVALAAQTAGVVTEVTVEAGDAVARGQVLARIDVREVQAELRRAQAQLAEQEVNVERLERLKARNYIDEASLSIARTQRDVARAEVGLWETRVDFGTVRAPINGVVTARYVEPGGAIGQLAPLLALADFDELVVRFGLSELDVAGLSVGDPVELQIDALGAVPPVEGRLRRIFPATESASRLVTVEVRLPASLRDQVRLGYLARATLTVDRREGVLAVPVGAVGLRSGQAYVMVVDASGALERRSVDLGVTRGDWREVVSGLSAGEAVVTANPADFAPGEPVRVVSEWQDG